MLGFMVLNLRIYNKRILIYAHFKFVFSKGFQLKALNGNL